MGGRLGSHRHEPHGRQTVLSQTESVDQLKLAPELVTLKLEDCIAGVTGDGVDVAA